MYVVKHLRFNGKGSVNARNTGQDVIFQSHAGGLVIGFAGHVSQQSLSAEAINAIREPEQP